MRKLIFLIALISVLGSFTAQAETCTQDSLTLTHGDTGDFVYGNGAGCILRPIKDVWAALQTESGMSFDGSSLDSSEQVTPPQGVLTTYQNSYSANGGIVSWQMDWHNMVKSGTAQNPQVVQVHYVKVSGTDFISYWEGDILLRAQNSGATLLTFTNKIHAAQTDENDAAATIQQIYNKLK